MAKFYFLYFSAIGVLQPHLYAYLRNRGLSEEILGVAFFLGPLAVLFSLPLWGSLSDLTGRADRVVQLTALASGITALGFLGNLPIVLLLCLVPVFYSFEYAIEPMLNSAVLVEDDDGGDEGEFGRSRLWGSVGFVVGAAAGGLLSNWWGRLSLFPGFLLIMFLLGALITRRETFRAPSVESGTFVQAVKDLLKNTRMLFLVLFMVLWSIPFTGNFMAFSWYWEEIGGSPLGLGVAWGLAAVLEVPFYLLTVKFWESVWLEGLLVISPLVAALRWGLYLLFPVPELIYWFQPLHSLMFVTFSVGTVYMMDLLAEDATRNTGQGLIGASVFGAGAALGNLLAGNLYGQFGPTVYYSSMIGVEALAFLVMLIVIFNLEYQH